MSIQKQIFSFLFLTQSTVQPRNAIPKYSPNRKESYVHTATCTEKQIVAFFFIHQNNPNVLQLTVVHSSSGILLISKKKQTTNTHDSLSECQMHYSSERLKRLHTVWFHLCDILTKVRIMETESSACQGVRVWAGEWGWFRGARLGSLRTVLYLDCVVVPRLCLVCKKCIEMFAKKGKNVIICKLYINIPDLKKKRLNK